MSEVLEALWIAFKAVSALLLIALVASMIIIIALHFIGDVSLGLLVGLVACLFVGSFVVTYFKL